MFLKRLELAGFKSFADKTDLEFVPGITAVVGPNGSGKSNISDSIRWVLGEQSARSLRGGKMEDIIFAGSDARKAVNFGEVSLTLDNADLKLSLDYSEVTVTRRIHRSGDSEYFINKQPCRLKDITELFMDTGIGKEAYSIIGQGRIEEILSTRSEDRRAIFEEASGIVKYKARKKEAEKKLSDTEQNLLRLHDLISELEDQVGPLRIQSEKAQQYKVYKQQLADSEISLYVHQLEQLHAAWQEAGQQLATLQEEQQDAAAVVSVHDAALEKDRWESRQLDEQLQQLQAALLALSAETEKNEGQAEVLKERERNLLANGQQLAESIAVQEKRAAEKQAEFGQFREKYEAVRQLLDALELKLVEEEDRLAIMTGGISSEQEEHFKAELLDMLNAAAQTRNEIRYIEQHVASLQRRCEKLEEEETRWNAQCGHIADRKRELEAKAVQLVEQLEQLRGDYVAISQRIVHRQDALEETLTAVRKWEQKAEQLTSRRDTMKEMQNDYDGFQHGVREVLRAKNGALRGIRGAVAELLRTPAELETAMETALGGALQNIVVETEANAREAIAYLKKRQSGRATFLPLAVIKGRFIPEQERRQIEADGGYIGIASSLIQYDAEYEQIFSSLLGNVVIAQTLEDANRIAAKCRYKYRVVTLEGDVVNPGGSMTGGSLMKRSANLLGRTRQIEELDQEIAATAEQAAALKQTAADMKREIVDDTKTMEELRSGGEQKRIEEQQVRAQAGRLDSEQQAAAAQAAVSAQERQELLRELSDNAEKKQLGEQRLAATETEQQRLQESLKRAEQARKSSESARETLQAEMTELKVRIASVSQEKQYLQEQIRRTQSEMNEQRNERRELERRREQFGQELETTREQALQLLEQTNLLRIRKGECAEQTEWKKAQRAEAMAALERKEDETREQRQRLKQTEEALHQTEVKANRLDVELDNLIRKLAEEYELSYELAKQQYPPPDDAAAAQQQVRELKRSIQALGEVSLGAIDEFMRVNERYTFLHGQREDLVQAKETLYQVIREMDEEMSKRFRATFEQIREQFAIVFVKLFGGGRADLILSEPSKLLDTGIEIVAQPPGKKLQNLQLLSGGERALTAIALLFAILRIKPVPFCVLDEVEAALDEANVSRFADYLRDFSDQTQFIVVTHRKGTMEEADVLYGITMEEGGVSKLVSVRLDDEDALTA